MPPASSVPGLQQKLFQRLGVAEAKSGGGKRGFGPASRKDQRKAQRQDKKSRRYSRAAPTNVNAHNRHRIQKTKRLQSVPRKGGQSALHSKGHEQSFDDSEDDHERGDEVLTPLDDIGEEGMRGSDLEEEDLDDMDGFDDDVDDDMDSSSDLDDEQASGKSFKSAKLEHLPEDDEIDEYERKLGIKGKKSLPKAFKDDGLDDIMGDLGGDVDSASEEGEGALKRKREDEDWLASKRKKAAQAAKAAKGESELSDGSIGTDNEGEDNDLDEETSFGGFTSGEEDEATEPKKEKENPYVAPKTGTIATKYIPPALRRAAGQDDAGARLRKQVQGLINRVTDDNILSIVQSVRGLYEQNARGAVTEAVTDTLLDQLCKPEALPDQFFVLSGGFCAALYKVIGSSFGSHVINEVVKLFGKVYETALAFTDAESGIPKEPSNIIAFLTQLYTFEVVSAKIVFDYMERLLKDLNEINVELLLRICRMAGALLRRDDPLTLKHVADELAKALKTAGAENTSVRTKFMVETINDLKNKKKKARGLESGVVSEAVQRMKKRLGELKSQNRRLDGLAPMGMSLDDVEGAETKGKWWLVGASVPARDGQYSRSKEKLGQSGHEDRVDPASDSEDMSIIFPDLTKKARGQSFTTETEIAIFTAVMGATDVKEGYQRFRNLRIKNNDRQQLAKVLVQCAGSEIEYNGYYAQLAKMACADGRIRFALKTRLWGIFRSLGEPLFGEAAEDEEETIDTVRMQDESRLEKVAMFYADLIYEGALGLDVLKPLDMPTITSWTMRFMNYLVFELLDGCRGNGEKEDAAVAKVFGSVRELPLLAAGVGWLLRERDPIATRRKLGPKKKERLLRVSEKAQIVLQTAAQ